MLCSEYVRCRCVASAAIQRRKLVVRSTKSPAGAVQPAQWRELEVSSSRAPAEFFDVMRNARRLSHLWCSSVSGGTADGEKTMRVARPQTPRQVRVTCTPANQFAVIIKIVWCRCVASAAIQLRKLVVRSTKSPAGAVQSAQWRELDLSSSRAPAEFPVVMRCPVGSRNFVPRPLAAQSVFFRGQLCRKYEFTVRRGKFLRLKSFILRFF